MTSSYPRQGEVYLIKALKTLGDTKKRPAVVISMNVRNEFKENVLIVPFTSDLTNGETPTRILIGCNSFQVKFFNGVIEFSGDCFRL
ncbi:MAG: type II toxin-antitoxin system PemK/MazF family toxin [Waterburya sp.]